MADTLDKQDIAVIVDKIIKSESRVEGRTVLPPPRQLALSSLQNTQPIYALSKIFSEETPGLNANEATQHIVSLIDGISVETALAYVNEQLEIKTTRELTRLDKETILEIISAVDRYTEIEKLTKEPVIHQLITTKFKKKWAQKLALTVGSKKK